MILEYFDDNGIMIPKNGNEIYLEKVSIHLFATFSIHILQQVFSQIENRNAYRTPLIPANTKPFIYVKIYSEYFTLVSDTQSQVSEIALPLSNELYTLLLNGDYSTASNSLIPLSFTVAFKSDVENTYKTVLEIYTLDLSDNKTILQTFDVIAYSVGEDVRLTTLLRNFGANISEDDIKIFPDTNSQEPVSDQMILNLKRKEFILNMNDIIPFIGSYKALINALKFFGYSNVKLKEYWKNLNTNSPLYNRYIATEIAKSLTDVQNFNDNSRISNSTIYKKTNLFGLFYDITVETDEIDEDGLPKIAETFRFSLMDLMIKIGALKLKLEKDFLPLSAKIIDIVGEYIFFGKISSKTWTNKDYINSQNINITPSFEVISNNNYIQDLRELSYLGCTIGSDLKLTNQSFLLHHRLDVIKAPKSSLLSEYTLTFTIGLDVQTEKLIVKNLTPFKEDWTLAEIAQKLVNLFSNSEQSFFKGHRYYVEPNTATIRLEKCYIPFWFGY
jgi:hypothetical protein